MKIILRYEIDGVQQKPAYICDYIMPREMASMLIQSFKHLAGLDDIKNKTKVDIED
jgi:hypothetical protein